MAWNDVPKPIGEGTVVIHVGMATGLLIPPTYAVEHSIVLDSWTEVEKPTSSVWGTVSKPIT